MGAPSDNVHVSELPTDVDQSLVESIFGAYGNISSVKFLPGGAKHAALVRFQTLDEAKWVVDNLHGNIPQGLSTPVQVKYAAGGKGGGGWNSGKGGDSWNAGKGERSSPYGKGGPGGYGGKAQPKGEAMGDNSIKTLKKGLQVANALPGGKWSNDAGALWIGGLPPDTTDLDLYHIFAAFGAIPANGVRAMLREDGTCKGYGFVNYIDPEAAEGVINVLHGTQMPDGSILEVKAKGPPGPPKGGGKGYQDGSKGRGKGSWKGGGKW